MRGLCAEWESIVVIKKLLSQEYILHQEWLLLIKNVISRVVIKLNKKAIRDGYETLGYPQ